ncbi:MAG: class I SAM-dependent methyltransferase [Gemmataceae bacterium]
MIRTLLWKSLQHCAKPLLRKRVNRGWPWIVSQSVWTRLTPEKWLTLEHHLLAHGEEFARSHIKTHPHLSQVIRDSDISASAITPLAALLTWQLIRSRKPSAILDLGSGVSSRLFALHARLCSEAGLEAPRIISVDHDQGWLEKTAENLDQYGLAENVKLVHAPLIDQELDGHAVTSYSLEPIADALENKRIDFLSIDGPPSSIGRAACLPLVSHLLNDSAVVLLDDFCREGERSAVQQWKQRFREEIRSIKCALTGRGMAIIEWSSAARKKSANLESKQFAARP